eukprot:6178857-Pleurochrysis_carterae.AAC.1
MQARTDLGPVPLPVPCAWGVQLCGGWTVRVRLVKALVNTGSAIARMHAFRSQQYGINGHIRGRLTAQVHSHTID